MTDRYGEFLKTLEDPAHYVKVSDVPVFDAHKEVYFLDPRGKMCSPKAPGAQKRVKNFDKQTLEGIARNCNERDSTGTLSPITKGHTIPDESDESKQPEIMGYAKDYHVRWDQRLKKWVIAANYYLRAECEKEARSYPRTSVELWPGDDVIDPIALLRRTPARDLGQWSYGKSQFHRAAGSTAWRFSRAGRPVLRYSMETKPMAEPWEDDADADTDVNAAPFGESGDDPEDSGKAMEFAKHCMSHPHAMHFAKKYAMADQPPEGDMDAPPAGDPTAPPDAAAPMMNRKKGPSRYARADGDSKKLTEVKQRLAESEGRNWVQQLNVVEGYDLDEEDTVRRFAKTFIAEGDAGCERYAEYIRRFHKERIDKPVGRIPVAVSPLSSRRGSKPESIDDLDEKQAQQVRQYKKDHKGLSFEDAFDAVFGSK